MVQLTAKRGGWANWYIAAKRWLRLAGVFQITAAMGADLMALFERDFEPQEAVFALVDAEEIG